MKEVLFLEVTYSFFSSGNKDDNYRNANPLPQSKVAEWREASLLPLPRWDLSYCNPFLSFCSGNINGAKISQTLPPLSVVFRTGTWISPRKWWRCTYPKSAEHSFCISLCPTELLMALLMAWEHEVPPSFLHCQHLWYCCDLREKWTSQSQGMATSCSWRAPFGADLHCLQEVVEPQIH